FVDTTTNTTLGTKVLDSAGKATLAVNSVIVGNHTIQATFNANQDFDSSSDTTGLVVSQGTTATTLTTSLSPSVFGQSVTFTATVPPNAPSPLLPAGTLTIVDTTTGATLGSGIPNGQGKFSVSSSALAVGTHALQATFSDPGGNYASSS